MGEIMSRYAMLVDIKRHYVNRHKEKNLYCGLPLVIMEMLNSFFKNRQPSLKILAFLFYFIFNYL